MVNIRFMLGVRELYLKAEVKSGQESIGIGLNFVGLNDTDNDYIKGYIEEHSRPGVATEQSKVLIVDDNDATRRMNKSKLVLDGFAVMEARDGIEAIAKLQADLPDLVVLDLYMEKMDGYKVLGYIRGSETLKHLPVIVFSARGTPAEIDRAMAAGATGFMVKMNTSPVKLSERIKTLLKDRQ